MTEATFFDEFERNRWDLTYADENNDSQPVIQVGIVASFYLEHAYLPERRQRIAQAFELYCQRYGKHLRWGYMGSEEVITYDFDASARQRCTAYIQADGYADAVSFMWSSAKGVDVVGDYSFQALLPAEWFERIHNALSAIRIYLPVEELHGQNDDFEDFIRTLCELLEPLHGSAGLGIQNCHEHQNYQHTEHEVLEAYRGVDLSLLIANESWRSGYTGLNWYTCLNRQWLQKLGHEPLSERLDDTRIRLIPYGSGTLIRCGDWPALGKADRDPRPELYVKLNELIKPLRVSNIGSLHYGSIAGEVRLNVRTSNVWLRRFDLPPGSRVPETPRQYRRDWPVERQKIDMRASVLSRK